MVTELKERQLGGYAGCKLSVQERPPAGQAASGAAEATTANSCNPGQQQHQCQCHQKVGALRQKRFKVLESHNFQRKQDHNCPFGDYTLPI